MKQYESHLCLGIVILRFNGDLLQSIRVLTWKMRITIKVQNPQVSLDI